MPIYSYKCQCGIEFDAIKTVLTRKTAPCVCGLMAKKVIALTSRPVVMEGYMSFVDEYITGPAHLSKIKKAKGIEEINHKEGLREHGGR